MNRTKTESLGNGAIAAGILCQAVHDGLQHTGQINAKSYLLWGSVAAVLWAALLWGYLSWGKTKRFPRRIVAVVAFLAALLGMIKTAAQAIELLGEFFFGSAGWLFLFFILIICWPVDSRALNSAGWALRWLAAAAGALLLAGVWQQLRWEDLSFVLRYDPDGVWLWCFQPDYLALPLILEIGSEKRAPMLPLLDVTVRGGFVLLSELVFGEALAQRLAYGELLRSWSLGIFSRYDSFLLMVWLMLALFRTAVFAWTLRRTGQLALGRETV